MGTPVVPLENRIRAVSSFELMIGLCKGFPFPKAIKPDQVNGKSVLSVKRTNGGLSEALGNNSWNFPKKSSVPIHTLGFVSLIACFSSPIRKRMNEKCYIYLHLTSTLYYSDLWFDWG